MSHKNKRGRVSSGNSPSKASKKKKAAAAAAAARSPGKQPDGTYKVALCSSTGSGSRQFTYVTKLGRAYVGPNPDKFLFNGNIPIVPGTRGTFTFGRLRHHWGIDVVDDAPSFWLELRDHDTIKIAPVHGDKPSTALRLYRAELQHNNLSAKGQVSAPGLFALSGRDESFNAVLAGLHPSATAANVQASVGPYPGLLSPESSPKKKGPGRPPTKTALFPAAGQPPIDQSPADSFTSADSPTSSCFPAEHAASSPPPAEIPDPSPWQQPLLSVEAVTAALSCQPLAILRQHGIAGKWGQGYSEDGQALYLTSFHKDGMDSIQVAVSAGHDVVQGVAFCTTAMHDGQKVAVDVHEVSRGLLPRVPRSAAELRDLLLFLGECTMCSGCCAERYKPFVAYHGPVFCKTCEV